MIVSSCPSLKCGNRIAAVLLVVDVLAPNDRVPAIFVSQVSAVCAEPCVVYSMSAPLFWKLTMSEQAKAASSDPSWFEDLVVAREVCRWCAC